MVALAAEAEAEDAARLIADALARVERRGAATAEEIQAAEAELVATATGHRGPDGQPTEPCVGVTVTFAELRVYVDTWTAWLDRDGIEPDAERASRNRSLTLGTPRDGLIPLRGDLMPETAAGLQWLLDAHLNPAVRFTPDPEERSTDEPWSPGTTRTRRRAPRRPHDPADPG